MFSKVTSVIATLALVSSVTAQSSTYSADLSTSTACPSAGGAHIIVARGSLEAPPYGVLVSVKDQILSQVPGSTADGTIGYPDTLDDYFNSESDGVLVARALITDFVSRCPGAPLVLFGYSQGANIMGDALLGQQDNGFPANASISSQLPSSVLNQVAALVLLGDPTFVVSENNFNAGNATSNGSFPRQNAELFNTTGLGERTRAYCDYNDLFCAGGSSLLVHVSYVNKYGSDMAAYAVSQIKKYYSSGAASSVSASAATTAAATAATTAGGVATGTVSGKATKTSACQSAASSGGLRTSRISSGVVATASATPSSSASAASSTSPTGAVSTGAASALSANMMSVAGAGAVVAGFFAAFL